MGTSSKVTVSKGNSSNLSGTGGVRNRLGVSSASSYVGDESFSELLLNHNELKFTIKMTKDEYKELLEMKRKMLEESKL